MNYKGHPVVEPGAEETQGRGWPAKFAGVCVRCRGAIAEGQPIERGPDGGYQHVVCSKPQRLEDLKELGLSPEDM